MNRHLSLLVFSVVFASFSNAQEPSTIPEENLKKRIPISHDTTFITKPISADGLINYQEHINRYLKQDIRTQDNAAVDYLKVIGNDEQVCSDPDFFKQLTLLIGTDPFVDSNLFLKDFASIYMEKSGAQYFDLEYRDFPEQRLALKFPWKREDHPIVAEWLRRNQKAIKTIIDGTKKKENFSPLLSVNEQQSVVYLVPIDVIYHPQFAEILRIHATLALGTKKPKDAIEAALAIHRLARHTSPRTTFEGIHAAAEVSMNAFIIDVKIANSDELSVRDLEQYLKNRSRLDELGDFNQGLLVERLIHLNTFQRAVTRDPILDSREQFTWELLGLSNRDKISAAYARAMIEQLNVAQFMKDINEFYTRLESGIKLNTYQQRTKSLNDFLRSQLALLEKHEKQKESPFAFFQTPEQKLSAIKATMFGTKTQQFQNSHDLMSSAMTVDRLSRLGIALSLHQKEMGVFPSSLKDISPKYIANIPTDPITGQPFNYRIEENQAVVYSVGLDLKDDGGKAPKIVEDSTLYFLGYQQQYDLVFPVLKSSD